MKKYLPLILMFLITSCFLAACNPSLATATPSSALATLTPSAPSEEVKTAIEGWVQKNKETFEPKNCVVTNVTFDEEVQDDGTAIVPLDYPTLVAFTLREGKIEVLYFDRNTRIPFPAGTTYYQVFDMSGCE